MLKALYNSKHSKAYIIDFVEVKPRSFRSGNVYIISYDLITPILMAVLKRKWFRYPRTCK